MAADPVGVVLGVLCVVLAIAALAMVPLGAVLSRRRP